MVESCVSEPDHPIAKSQKPANPSRRNLLFVGGAAAAAASAWYIWPTIERLIPRSFSFEPYDNPKGFRRLSAGPVTGDGNVLVDLNDRPTRLNERAAAAVRANLCNALFGRVPVPPGVVPIASFSDYNCPYCRVLSGMLANLEDHYPQGLRVTWYEWPMLGRSSRIMARGALAARRQGKYEEFHHFLMQSRLIATRYYLEELARLKGIDPEVLVADMRSPEVAWDIATSTALAQVFGFRGTPALVVGRTAVAGAIGQSSLKALIRQETCPCYFSFPTNSASFRPCSAA